MTNETNNDPTPNPLDALAARVLSDPFFLASVLATYPARPSLDDAELAAVLGCSVDVLTSLRLCRRPGAAQPGRTAAFDVAAMAARFGVAAAALRQVVEESDKRP